MINNKSNKENSIDGLESQVSEIRTRIAPSPTGTLHIGTARTALFNYLFARQNGGKFILRIEDTDKDRSKKEYEDDILEGLKWLGFEYDEFYRQSERSVLYKKYIKQLIDSDKAYISKEESRAEVGKEIEVVRLRNKNEKIKFDDMVRGEIEFDTTELGDFVIARSIDEPLYHLAVVIDDYEMDITHIIRGDDHISNTPRQILIQEALGIERPQYAHIPLILASDRSKLSKRHGAVSVSEYRKMGYLREAFINYMALLGWNPGDDRELFTIDELIKEFDIKKIQKGGAVFDIEKLNWFNKEYIKKMSDDELFNEFKKYNLGDDKIVRKILSIIKERINTFGDLREMADNGELDYYFKKPQYDVEKLSWRDTDLSATKKHLEKVIELLESMQDSEFSAEKVKEKIWDYAEKEGKGDVLWPMRYALSGRDKSPDPFVLAGVLEKEEVIERIKMAIDKIGK